MEIRCGSMYYQEKELKTPPAPCSVCEKEFQPLDDMDFICPECKEALKGRCSCGYDDVVMDWGIDTEAEKPYYWIIECLCGRSIKTEQHGLDDMNKFAKELHAEWCK